MLFVHNNAIAQCLQSIAFRLVAMTTLWSRDREIQEIARKVPDPLSMKAGSGNETKRRLVS